MPEVSLPPAPARSRLLGALAPLGIAMYVALATAWLHPITTYLADLAATLAILWALLAIPSVVFLTWRRRRIAAGVVAIAGIIAWGSLWRTPRLGQAPRSIPSSQIISILVFNGSSSRLSAPEKALAMLHDLDPDVIVLIEPSRTLLDLIRADDALARSHPFRRLPDTAKSGWRLVLTRWPQQGGPDFAGGAEDAAHGGMHVMVVDRPAGAFGLVQVNPESPRTLARWRAGNARVEGAINAIRERLMPRGVPVIVAGDLNASPTGARSARLARGADLARAKPRFVLDGTFPAGLPAVFRLPIDDVFASPGVGLVEWRVLPSCGSDHRAVLVRLCLP
ncbi:MAG: endonuclease/exonuclease/phosphatase family protein [Phycisphaerales bacterium]|nr:endonuclease/exonuclease/phosphatase family protein [Phycisphaerales bacterium]